MDINFYIRNNSTSFIFGMGGKRKQGKGEVIIFFKTPFPPIARIKT
jgi:hypothetical protein